MVDILLDLMKYSIATKGLKITETAKMVTGMSTGLGNVLVGAASVSPKMLISFVTKLRITEDQELLSMFLLAYLANRLGVDGSELLEKSGLSAYLDGAKELLDSAEWNVEDPSVQEQRKRKLYARVYSASTRREHIVKALRDVGPEGVQARVLERQLRDEYDEERRQFYHDLYCLERSGHVTRLRDAESGKMKRRMDSAWVLTTSSR